MLLLLLIHQLPHPPSAKGSLSLLILSVSMIQINIDDFHGHNGFCEKEVFHVWRDVKTVKTIPNRSIWQNDSLSFSTAFQKSSSHVSQCFTKPGTNINSCRRITSETLLNIFTQTINDLNGQRLFLPTFMWWNWIHLTQAQVGPSYGHWPLLTGQGPSAFCLYRL